MTEIKRLGGSVYYAYEHNERDPFGSSPRPPGPDWLRRLMGEHCLTHVEHVYLQHYDVSSWKYKPVTDADLAVLDDLPHLQHLHLSGADISAVGIRQICRIHHLKVLSLSCTSVTDESLKSLLDMTSLQEVNVSGTKVTDTTLETFSRLPNLEKITISGTAMTNEAIDEFKRRRPACIVWDNRTFSNLLESPEAEREREILQGVWQQHAP